MEAKKWNPYWPIVQQAYLIPAVTYEMLLEKIEDHQLGLIVKDRQNEKVAAIEVNLDEL